ncbi:MAG: type II toxin-antitoxin system RelE/ParE family toxin [Chloroflexi bacterium]|nr:type II toxin-antitoxin system RelE/ParE family toxin [Chloroflexota bacterium]
MASYRLSSQARTDMLEVWVYVAEDNGVESARSLNRQFLERFPLLAEYPHMGRARPELAPDVRSFPISSFVVLYRPTDYGVDILRIVHGRRQLETMFFQ